MTDCLECGSPAGVERVTVLASSDGPVLLTRWRCGSDPTHWWDAGTDAAPPMSPASAEGHPDPTRASPASR
jgi:hypothetical protein